MKITQINFKPQSDNITTYCLETPNTLFKYSNTPVLLVTECDKYGKVICDSIYKWDDIRCIYEVKANDEPEHNFIDLK